MNLASASLPESTHYKTTPTTDDPEWAILLAAISVGSPDKKTSRLLSLIAQPLRWERLFALADHHGIEPLLYQALAPLASELPHDKFLRLKQGQPIHLHKALLLSRELIRIVDHLSAMGIFVLPYKGLALAEMVYGDIALRQSGDIDLLIHPRDFFRVRDAVTQLGYIPHDHFSQAQQRAQLKFGYECSFDGAAAPNLLELQWAIQPRFYSIDFDMPGLFERSTPVVVAGQPMRTLSLEDSLLVLSAHAAKHVWGRLIWLCDLARIITRPELNWEWIRSEAAKLGLLRILQVTLHTANHLLAAPIPEGATGLSRENVPSWLMQEVDASLRGETAFNVESLNYFRLMVQLRECKMDQFRFLARLMFTPGPGEWNLVRLPDPLFPLYRLVRLARLAARLLRS
ncbi:MAG TPA: nucleotidyltransferase family protein [Verrucomicrobiae bacterium]|nr:nucleotidyltransferase family protein [Verrucomicrobiae bacterium]